MSDKRCYFQGTSYEITYKNNGRKKLNKTNRSRTVDLKDITGTGFDYIQNILYKYIGFAFAVWGGAWVFLGTVAFILDRF